MYHLNVGCSRGELRLSFYETLYDNIIEELFVLSMEEMYCFNVEWFRGYGHRLKEKVFEIHLVGMCLTPYIVYP